MIAPTCRSQVSGQIELTLITPLVREHPPGGSLWKQHLGRDSLARKRRSCGWSEDFMLEVPTGATI